MSTLKSYRIHFLEAEISQIQRKYLRLRQLIELGDMQAVVELSEIRKNITQKQTVITNYQRKFQNTAIEVYLFGLSTILSTLLDSHQTTSTIKEERTSLPWKRQNSQNNHKLNSTKKNQRGQIFDTNRSKSHNQSRLTKSVSEKTIDSRETIRVIGKQSKQKLKEKQNKNQVKQFQNCKHSQKDKISPKEQIKVSERKQKELRTQKGIAQNQKLIVQNKNLVVQSQDRSQNIVTIKIGPQEFQEIIKLKNARLNEISLGS